MADIRTFTPERISEYTNLELTRPISADLLCIQEESIELKIASALISQEQYASLKLDENLSFYLSEILQKQEISLKVEGSTDKAKPGILVNQSLKSWLPKNFSFRGIPTEFRSTDTNKIVDTLLKSGDIKDILQKVGQNSTRYGIRCKIFSYPEDRLAVWIMVACMYLDNEN